MTETISLGLAERKLDALLVSGAPDVRRFRIFEVPPAYAGFARAGERLGRRSPDGEIAARDRADPPVCRDELGSVRAGGAPGETRNEGVGAGGRVGVPDAAAGG